MTVQVKKIECDPQIIPPNYKRMNRLKPTIKEKALKKVCHLFLGLWIHYDDESVLLGNIRQITETIDTDYKTSLLELEKTQYFECAST